MKTVTIEQLHRMQDIEAIAYPAYMQSIVDCDTITELADYCECKVNQLYCIVGENYYLLAANKKKTVEIVDFASTGRCIEIFKVMTQCFKDFKGKKVTMDCRETTSYPIVTKLLNRKGVSYTCAPWDWGGETMYEIHFTL